MAIGLKSMRSDANNSIADVALLAPVPFAHLVSAQNTLKCHGKVAFGSQNFQLFRQLELERGGLFVDAYIYASHREKFPDGEPLWLGL